MYTKHLPPVGQARQLTSETSISNEAITLASATAFFAYILPILNRSKPKSQLKDFPMCGLRDETYKNREDECLWSCAWKENTEYRETIKYTVLGSPMAMDILLNLPLIPQDLSCLKNCKADLVNSIDKFYYICIDFQTGAPLYASYLDCALDKSKKTDLKKENYFIAGGQPFPGSVNAIDMVISVCFHATQNPTLYGNQNCEDLLGDISLIPKTKRKRKNKKKKKDKQQERNTKTRSKKVTLADISLFLPNRSDNTRVTGPSSKEIDTKRYPWQCSMRTRGYRGHHRCSVTLLSASPTILVSTASCNFICKDKYNTPQNPCCCVNEGEAGSCKKESQYCRDEPSLKEANSRDFQIVCGENFIGTAPEQTILNKEDEVVLDIEEILIHPDYNSELGPLGGNDIAVYKIKEEQMKLDQKNVYPACLPRSTYDFSRSVLSGWKKRVPNYKNIVFYDYKAEYFYPRQVGMEETTCIDPSWMKSNSYYPSGTVCYKDPSSASCLEFGNGGAGVMRKLDIDPTTGNDTYSFVGPVSMYKGCDRAWIIDRPSAIHPLGIELSFAGENPVVLTSANCFMDWVADMYGMVMPNDYIKNSNCKTSHGDKTDANKDQCLTDVGTQCNFVDGGKCETFMNIEEPLLMKTCTDTNGETHQCPNNCKGVDGRVIFGEKDIADSPATRSLLPETSVITKTAGIFAMDGVGAVALTSTLRALMTLGTLSRSSTAEEKQSIAGFENTEVVFATTFFTYLYQILNTASPTSTLVLEDYEDCGVRNNKTAALQVDECLWGCTWKENPYYREVINIPVAAFGAVLDLHISLFKIPTDLRCIKKTCILPYLNKTFLPILYSQRCGDMLQADASLTIYDCAYVYSALLNQNLQIQGQYNTIETVLATCYLAAKDPDLYLGEDCVTLGIIPNPQKYKRLNKERNNERLLGSASEAIETENSYPWMCSLRTRDRNNQHRCGLTLLSGPPNTILTSAAHCNYFCKNKYGDLLEICCCREETEPGSCRKTSSFCRDDPGLVLAKPKDVRIICKEHKIGEETLVDQASEVVLDVEEIIIHPRYSPEKGPINGYDIATYKIVESQLEDKLEKMKLWPACLPKASYTDKRSIFAAWRDPEPVYRQGDGVPIFLYEKYNLYPKQINVEEVPCQDPDWMGSDTFYPQSTVCYRDPSCNSCYQFGSSGSGVVRRMDTESERYSWVGPLSLYKGCDRMSFIRDAGKGLNGRDTADRITYAGENPGVVTSGHCFLPWIAEQYDMILPSSYKRNPSCDMSSGSRADKDVTTCPSPAGNGATCNFENNNVYNQSGDEPIVFDQCKLLSQEGYAYIINGCMDTNKELVQCPNNCKGTNPNSIVVGGLAVFLGGATAFQTLLPLFGLAGPAVLAGAGYAAAPSFASSEGACLPPRCQVGDQCCLVQFNPLRGRFECPPVCV